MCCRILSGTPTLQDLEAALCKPAGAALTSAAEWQGYIMIVWRQALIGSLHMLYTMLLDILAALLLQNTRCRRDQDPDLLPRLLLWGMQYKCH